MVWKIYRSQSSDGLMDERDKCSDLKIEMDWFESVMNLQNPKTQMERLCDKFTDTRTETDRCDDVSVRFCRSTNSNILSDDV